MTQQEPQMSFADISCSQTATINRAHARTWIRIVAVVVFALLTALGAQVKVPLPGTPVPMTLQTLVVLLSGLTLGPWLGSASMALYLLLGMAGMPVFADTVGSNGMFFGATGGYLIGFVLSQPAVGLIARLRSTKPVWPAAILATFTGHAIIFGCGLIWLAAWLDIGLTRTLELGLWPFMIGMLLKTGVAAGLGGVSAPLSRWLQAKT